LNPIVYMFPDELGKCELGEKNKEMRLEVGVGL